MLHNWRILPQIITMASFIGKLVTYVEAAEPWPCYQECLGQYFIANDIDDTKKVPDNSLPVIAVVIVLSRSVYIYSWYLYGHKYQLYIYIYTERPAQIPGVYIYREKSF